MLKSAKLYEDKLNKERLEVRYDEKYQYYFTDAYSETLTVIPNNDYDCIQFVSVDSSDNVVGYFCAWINRQVRNITGLAIINFKTKGNLTFSKDLFQFLKDLFFKFGYNKINFEVVIGNPIEKMYDKFIYKYGGRIVGIKRRETTLLNGSIADMKIYEIFKNDFREVCYKKKGWL